MHKRKGTKKAIAKARGKLLRKWMETPVEEDLAPEAVLTVSALPDAASLFVKAAT